MKVQLALLAAVASVAFGASADAVGFTAYNDCQSSTGGNASGVTVIGYGGVGAALTGQLTDFATNTPVTATATMTPSGINTAGSGPTTEFTAGSDAANLFGGKVINTGSVIYYGTGAWYVDLTFANLTPGARYTLATTLDRGIGTAPITGYYTNRWSVISLSGADSSTYASSAGAFQVSPTDTTIQSYNSINGYVAKWTDIDPGADNSFGVRYTYATAASQYPAIGPTQDTNKGYGPAMFMLQETTSNVPEPATLSLLGLAALPLLARRRRA